MRYYLPLVLFLASCGTTGGPPAEYEFIRCPAIKPQLECPNKVEVPPRTHLEDVVERDSSFEKAWQDCRDRNKLWDQEWDKCGE